MKRTKIDIYGRRYTVSSEYEDRYIDRLTQYVNSKIKELVIKNPRLDYADACALCLLNVADEIATAQDKLNSVSSKLEELENSKGSFDSEAHKLKKELEDLNKKNNELENEIRKRDNEIIKLKMNLEDKYQKQNPEKNFEQK